MSSLARELTVRVRSISGVRHPLPDFLVIGIKKGGTSSLDNHLRQHPDVRGASRKEVRFFHQHWRRGTWWYRGFFPPEAEVRIHAEQRGRRPLLFEATPDYLYWPDVPSRVARTLPKGRFVALLRNPVDRAWSDYNSHRGAGRESRPFEEVVSAELAVLAGPQWDPHRFGDEVARSARLLSLGFYADQLERWYQAVDRSSVLVLASEDLFADTAAVLDQVTDFLGLTRFGGYRLAPRNVGSCADPMPAHVRGMLAEHFEPHNRRLYTLLGRDLGWA